ncbi:hypothetical protein AB0B79_31545 [Streptomyces sp. NPDC039022]|uniref:hypothetical protein n=1 Tax=Streptomyces sp. NPDC039022 TaxID=3157091 RepID=UPI0033C37DCB
MITQTTSPPEAAEAQRRGHLAALAVVEQIISTCPIVPPSASVTCYDFAPEKPRVEVHYTSAAGMEALAQMLSATVTTEPFGPDDPRPYMTMHGELAGVPIRASALLNAPARCGSVRDVLPCVLDEDHDGDVHRDAAGYEWPTADAAVTP